ncbi:single-stranded DNA-binding protein [Desulfopila aestuarii]|uniref:Single-stranded DNA-binding protein n=1 Tax=Desulfopila aestuarii DSM 18488 TaxID=1121416 RepID=A0A1M7YLJ0_9BACT|nr:single-stranded DNA-binding protein [Desulfopila aestuarii]SHO53466.1 single-strand binding protein [Desulfopila aestuarii DSM 18488]
MQKTQLIGNLGNDPELREAHGKPVCTFSVATTERWKDQQGDRQEKTEWHKVVAWDQLAKTCAHYLKRGARVYIEGKNRTRKWTDQNGVERYVTEIVAKEMEMLGTPGNSSTPPGYSVPPGHQDDVPF